MKNPLKLNISKGIKKDTFWLNESFVLWSTSTVLAFVFFVFFSYCMRGWVRDCCLANRLLQHITFGTNLTWREQQVIGFRASSEAAILHLLVPSYHLCKISHNKVLTSVLTLVLSAQGRCQDHNEAGWIKPPNLLYETADTYWYMHALPTTTLLVTYGV